MNAAGPYADLLQAAFTPLGSPRLSVTASPLLRTIAGKCNELHMASMRHNVYNGILATVRLLDIGLLSSIPTPQRARTMHTPTTMSSAVMLLCMWGGQASIFHCPITMFVPLCVIIVSQAFNGPPRLHAFVFDTLSWHSFMRLVRGTRSWHSSKALVRGPRPWHWSVALLRGTRLWHSSVAFVCGTRLWPSTVALVCGTHPWHMFVAHVCVSCSLDTPHVLELLLNAQHCRFQHACCAGLLHPGGYVPLVHGPHVNVLQSIANPHRPKPAAKDMIKSLTQFTGPGYPFLGFAVNYRHISAMVCAVAASWGQGNVRPAAWPAPPGP